jgi:hypothetical protein
VRSRSTPPAGYPRWITIRPVESSHSKCTPLPAYPTSSAPPPAASTSCQTLMGG